MSDCVGAVLQAARSSAGRLTDAQIVHLQRREARRVKQETYRKKIGRSIPPLFAKAHIRHIPEHLRSLLFQRSPEQGLLLWGPVGAGKSYALAALARYYAIRGLSVRRITYRELCLKLRASFVDKSTSEADILRPYFNAHILIIDDIGTAHTGGTESDYSQEVLLHIVDTRIENMRPTFLSSNLSIENIEAAFGQGTGSRLHSFMILRINGEDRRRSNG